MKRSSSGGSGRSGDLDWLTQNPVLVLIALNILFFLATSIKPGLMETLGMTPALVLQRPWTLITNMFIHEGLWHILFNMIALFFFGRVLNQLIGVNKFLVVYFSGGILGNILFILLNIGSYSLVVGASGAIYAVAGALVVMVPKMRVALYGIIPMPLWVFAIIFLGLLSIPPFAGFDVAWQAHMGGLAAGLVAGFIFRRSRRGYIIY
jgi:uncharacterized protein